MATRAQEFKSEQMRAAQARKPKATKKKVARAWRKPGQRRARGTELGLENESPRAGRKALVAIEDNASGKRSRKSTRPASNKGKNSSMLEYASRMKMATAAVRHSRRG